MKCASDQAETWWAKDDLGREILGGSRKWQTGVFAVSRVTDGSNPALLNTNAVRNIVCKVCRLSFSWSQPHTDCLTCTGHRLPFSKVLSPAYVLAGCPPTRSCCPAEAVAWQLRGCKCWRAPKESQSKRIKTLLYKPTSWVFSSITCPKVIIYEVCPAPLRNFSGILGDVNNFQCKQMCLSAPCFQCLVSVRRDQRLTSEALAKTCSSRIN